MLQKQHIICFIQSFIISLFCCSIKKLYATTAKSPAPCKGVGLFFVEEGR